MNGDYPFNQEPLPPPLPEPAIFDALPQQLARPLFTFDAPPPALPPPVRQPDIGQFALMLLHLVAAIFIVGFTIRLLAQFHLFGIKNFSSLLDDIRLQLGLQMLAYLLTFIGCLIVMPMLWNQPYFKALSWRAYQLPRRIPLLLSAAVLCFTLAILSSMLFSDTSKNAPIEQAFNQPGAPWLLFIFGITAAPFFEEMAFRGFMLPAFATAFDWSREHILKRTPPQNDFDGTPRWTTAALTVSSVITSIAFAAIHAPQTAGSINSLILLFGVSLVLCFVRILTRSLAASTLVHALYNLIIFGMMILYTNGFQHMDKL